MEGCGNGKVVMGSMPVKSNSFTVSYPVISAGTVTRTIFDLAHTVENPDISGNPRPLPLGALNTAKASSIRINSLNVTKGSEISGVSLKLSEIQPDGSMLQVGAVVNLDVLNTMCANQLDKITVNSTAIVVQKNQMLEVSFTSTGASRLSISGNLTQQF